MTFGEPTQQQHTRETEARQLKDALLVFADRMEAARSLPFEERRREVAAAAHWLHGFIEFDINQWRLSLLEKAAPISAIGGGAA